MDLFTSSLNHGDTFILDSKKLFLWMGTDSNTKERTKGMWLVKKINEEQGNLTTIVILEDGKEKKNELEEFLQELNNSKGGIKKDSGTTDEQEERNAIKGMKLFRVSEASGRLEVMVWIGDTISKELLDSAACFVLDCQNMVYVWTGTYSSMSERSWALLKAEELISHGSRPACIDISWVVESDEGIIFKDQFLDWQDRSWDESEEELKQQQERQQEQQRNELKPSDTTTTITHKKRNQNLLIP